MQNLFVFSFIVVQLEKGAHKVSEKLYFMKKFLYIRKLLSENYQIFGRNLVSDTVHKKDHWYICLNVYHISTV